MVFKLRPYIRSVKVSKLYYVIQIEEFLIFESFNSIS